MPVQILPIMQFLEDVAGNGQTDKACEDMIKFKSIISQMCCLSAATAGPTSLSALAAGSRAGRFTTPGVVESRITQGLLRSFNVQHQQPCVQKGAFRQLFLGVLP